MKSFHNTSIGTLFDNRFKRDLEKYKSKLVVIIGDFFLSDPQITTEDKDWLYPQMIKAIKEKVKDSIILVFSPTKLSNFMNYG